jgi:AraC family transcriptional regulator
VTKALSILSGSFGRVALLDMDTSLVDHAHPHCHLILKVSGPDQDFVVEGQPYPLRYDTAVAVNTWQQHEYVHRPGPMRTVFLALYIEPNWLADADGSFTSCAGPGFFAKPCIPITGEIARLRAKLLRRIEGDPAAGSKEFENLILDLSLEVAYGFSEWRARTDKDCGRRTPRDFRIHRAVHYMRDHVGQNLDLNSIAKFSGLSRPHFNHLFRHCTGVSPAVYGNALRIEAAVGTLRQQPQHIASISEQLGFSAQSNFTRFFQQHTGTSPNQFRRVMACLN